MTLSKKASLQASKSKFTTKTKYLTIVVKRDYKKSRNYDVEIMIEPTRGRKNSKYLLCTFLKSAVSVLCQT